MRLSEKRKLAIYNAASEPVVKLRVAINLGSIQLFRLKPQELDALFARLQADCGSAALRAAEGMPEVKE